MDTEWSADWDLQFRSLYDELEYEITQIEGTLPPSLQGSWWRTGPGNFELGGTNIRTVDSDGMIVRITFDGNGRAFFKNRYVRTEGFMREQKAGKVLQRGVFGTLPTDEEHLRGTRLEMADVMKGGPPKNVSNTALLHLPTQHRILSMWEGGESLRWVWPAQRLGAGLPHSVDPHSMDTLGIETFGGLLRPRSIFSAHPCLEASTQRLVNFGVKPGTIASPTPLCQNACSYQSEHAVSVHIYSLSPVKCRAGCPLPRLYFTPWHVLTGMTPKLTLWEFDISTPAVKLVQEHKVELTGQGVIHDMCLTPNWIVIVHDPVSFNVEALMTKGSSVDDLLAADEDESAATFIYLIPRDPSLLGGNPGSVNELCTQYTCTKGFSYHHATAWEAANGDVLIDSVVYAQKPDLDMRDIASRVSINTSCGKGRLMRYCLPRPSSAGEADGEHEPVVLQSSPKSCEMPIVRSACQGAQSRVIYTIDMFCDQVNRPWSALLKSDIETGVLTEWRAPARCYIGEPCFVPRKVAEAAEDDGWLMVMMFDPCRQRSALLVLDALDVSNGPVCKLWLKHHVPFSTHTMWTAQAFGIGGSAKL